MLSWCSCPAPEIRGVSRRIQIVPRKAPPAARTGVLARAATPRGAIWAVESCCEFPALDTRRLARRAGAVARALLADGEFDVRAVARDAASGKARALADL